LSTPYQYIAADVNNSGSISGLDLIELRKAILGITEEFINNESWRFIDSDFNFNENIDPLGQAFDEDYNIPVLNNDMLVDFIGVKIGDVNGTAVTSYASNDLETRSSNVLQLEGNLEGERLVIRSNHSTLLRGLQMTIEYNKQFVDAIGMEPKSFDISNDSYFINQAEGFITMTWNADQLRKIESGEELFAIVFDGEFNLAAIELTSLITKAEAYNEDFEVMDIEYDGGNSVFGLALLQNEPNPWVARTSIKYTLDADQEVIFYFRDPDGKLIKKLTTSGSRGNNELWIEASDLNVNASVVYYEMQTQTNRIMRKMILVH